MISAGQIFRRRWQLWRQQSVNRRIFAAAITVGGLTVLVNLVVVVRELVVANQFGTGDALDAFLIAYLLPSFAISVVAGSFGVAFIPTYIQVREQEGLQAAQQLFSNAMFGSIAILIAVSVLMALAAPQILPLLGSGFDPAKLTLTNALFFILLPSLLVNGLSKMWGAVLNASERFASAAIAPIMMPLTAVLALVFIGKTWGIYALALGTVAGYTLEAVILAWVLKRQGFSLLLRWPTMNPSTKQVARQYAPMVAGAVLMSGTGLVNQSMAAMLSPGSVAALSYGGKVMAFMLGIGNLALGTAVLPHFSRMVATADWNGIKHTLKTYARLILLVTIPLTFIVVYFSEHLVSLLFERGAFTAADTHLVGRLQAFFFLQVPFQVLGILGVRLLSAMAKNHLLMIISGINLIVNIIGNYFLMRLLGVEGISLSSSVVYAISMALIFVALGMQLKRRNLSNGR